MITHLSKVRQSPFPRCFLRHSRETTTTAINAINNIAAREAAAINAVKKFLSSFNICLLGTVGRVVESVKTTTTTTEINDLNDVTGGVNNTKKRDRFRHGSSREQAPSSSE